MNRLILSGNLTKEVELKQKGDLNYLTNSIAFQVYDSKKKEYVTNFINIIIYGKKAENFAKHHKKGSQCVIAGQYTCNINEVEGKKYTNTLITVDEYSIIFEKKDNSNE